MSANLPPAKQRREMSDLIRTPGGQLAAKQRLAECLEEAWKEIPGSFFKALYESTYATSGSCD